MFSVKPQSNVHRSHCLKRVFIVLLICVTASVACPVHEEVFSSATTLSMVLEKLFLARQLAKCVVDEAFSRACRAEHDPEQVTRAPLSLVCSGRGLFTRLSYGA